MRAQRRLAAELRDTAELASPFPFSRFLRPVLEALEGDGDSYERRREEYLDLFLLSAGRSACALYESAYVDRAGRFPGVVGAGVARAYAEAGLELAPEVEGEPPDHAALELEFLGLLCSEESEAWSGRLRGRAYECLERQAEFLDRHPLRWFGPLATAIDAAAGETSLYRDAAEAAGAFLVHDRDLVDAVLGRQLRAEVTYAGAR